MCTKIVPSLFQIVYVLYINVCMISSNRSRNMLNSKNLENVWLQRWTIWMNHFNQIWKTLIYIGVILNIKFHEILFVSFQAALFTKFLPYTDLQTHRQHFPEIVKSCSGHFKTRKSIKNQKSKICTKAIFSSTYIEESYYSYFSITYST